MAASAAEPIELAWGDFNLSLNPAAGGSVAGFRWRDTPLFRACDPRQSPAEPLNLAGFPLFPFASRIAGNRFPWPAPGAREPGDAAPHAARNRTDVQGRSREIVLPPNLLGEPLALHGQSWRHPWRAEPTPEGGCRLTYDHAAGSWPWQYRAEQRFEPTPDGFDLTLMLTNLDETPMPGGLGWHPYLHRGDARLSTGVQGRIRGAGDPPGPRRIPHPGFRSAPVEGLDLDHGFYGWDGKATVRWPSAGLGISMTATGPLDHLIIYVPPGADFFCVEPVSHLPDAANWRDELPNGWRSIPPGGRLRGTIRIDAGPWA